MEWAVPHLEERDVFMGSFAGSTRIRLEAIRRSLLQRPLSSATHLATGATLIMDDTDPEQLREALFSAMMLLRSPYIAFDKEGVAKQGMYQEEFKALVKERWGDSTCDSEKGPNYKIEGYPNELPDDGLDAENNPFGSKLKKLVQQMFVQQVVRLQNTGRSGIKDAPPVSKVKTADRQHDTVRTLKDSNNEEHVANELKDSKEKMERHFAGKGRNAEAMREEIFRRKKIRRQAHATGGGQRGKRPIRLTAAECADLEFGAEDEVWEDCGEVVHVDSDSDSEPEEIVTGGRQVGGFCGTKH